MDAWFRIATHYGAELHVDMELAVVCSAGPATAADRFRGLLAWQPAGRDRYWFLTPNEQRVTVFGVPPDPFANTVLPFRVSEAATDSRIAFFYPGTRRFLCAAPPNP